MTKELIFTKINDTIQNSKFKNTKYTKKDFMYAVLLAVFAVLFITGIIILSVAVAKGHYRSSISTFVCVPFTAFVITSIAFAIYRHQYKKLMNAFSLLLNFNKSIDDDKKLEQAISFINKKDKSFFNNKSKQEIYNQIVN